MPSTYADRYETLPDPPGEPGAVTVLARLLDALAFRYRWAVEGLGPDDLAWTPGKGSMTLGELLLHMRQLVGWVGRNVSAGRDGGEPVVWAEACDRMQDPGPDPAALTEQILGTIAAIRADLLALGDGGLDVVKLLGSSGPDVRPFWNAINGPLADFLTHVGQINSWRRLMGNLPPRADVFRGRPPRA
jgi:hypothetical protein